MAVAQTRNSRHEPGRLERRKARTRAAILSAASRLFHDNGFDDTSIQQIAELADTGVGTLYGYFASKDEVLREVLRQNTAEAIDRYRASVDRSTPSIDRVTGALDSFARYLQDNRRLLRDAFQVGTRDARVGSEANDWLLKVYSDLLSTGIERGELRTLPIETTALMLVSVYSLAMLGLGPWYGRDEASIQSELREITRALLLPG